MKTENKNITRRATLAMSILGILLVSPALQPAAAVVPHPNFLVPLTQDGDGLLVLDWDALVPGETVMVGVPTHFVDPGLGPMGGLDEKECIFPYDTVRVLTRGSSSAERGVHFKTVFGTVGPGFEPLNCFLIVDQKIGIGSLPDVPLTPVSTTPVSTPPAPGIGAAEAGCNTVAWRQIRSSAYMEWATPHSAAIVANTEYRWDSCGNAYIDPETSYHRDPNPTKHCNSWFLNVNYCETSMFRSSSDDLGYVWNVAEGGFSGNLPCWKWSCWLPIYASGRLWAGMLADGQGNWWCVGDVSYDKGLSSDEKGVRCRTNN